uniref:Uncharacterized protein n=1 Tax=Pseudoalteromonas citrea DSM 8771 TaxID=1117314 RepID=U1JJ46_9GAMM
MKLKLNKKAVKSLSNNDQTLGNEATPLIGGGGPKPGHMKPATNHTNPVICMSSPVCWTVSYCR